MNLLAPITSIMTKGVISVSKSTSMKEVEKIFSENNFHHLPVTEGGKLEGMISKSDFLFFKRGYNDSYEEDKVDSQRTSSYTAGEIMTDGVAYLESDAKINVALDIFNRNLFHAIPVIEDGLVVGIVTTFDIIKRVSEDKEITEEYV